MTDSRKLVIEPLNTGHGRQGFYCGVEVLDHYLKKQARQNIKRRISRVFVATMGDNPGTVLGYYTLSALSIELNTLPEKLARKLPKHPIPAALIGRLAVSQTVQKHGIGKLMLADGIKRILAVSDQIAVYALIVNAIDESAGEFYRQYGFRRLSDDSPRLFLPLKTIGS